MLIFEALRAKFGDSLLIHWGTAAKPRLAVIDGGPPGVYADALKPRLDEIRKARKLDPTKPLDLDLVMVSHIDDDHIAGLLQLMRKLKELRDSKMPLPWKARRFWHNSFDDIVGNDDETLGTPASGINVASLGDHLLPSGQAVVATVGQGRDLRELISAFHLEKNQPLGGLARAGLSPVKLDGLKLTVIAPLAAELDALQKEWDAKIKAILKKPKKSTAELAEIAAYLDGTASNCSSIVVLAEAEGKRILLTGDGRGDHTLTGLEKAKLVDKKGRIRVDLLKVPHHGSDRNVDVDYFERILAKHLVISADGKHDNPDVDTLEMISKARPDDAFTLHLTYAPGEFNVPAVGKAVGKFLDKEKAKGRKYKVVTRKTSELGLKVKLA